MERAVPILPGNDVSTAKKFYVDGLGFIDLIDPFGNTIFVMGPLAKEI